MKWGGDLSLGSWLAGPGPLPPPGCWPRPGWPLRGSGPGGGRASAPAGDCPRRSRVFNPSPQPSEKYPKKVREPPGTKQKYGQRNARFGFWFSDLYFTRNSRRKLAPLDSIGGFLMSRFQSRQVSDITLDLKMHICVLILRKIQTQELTQNSDSFWKHRHSKWRRNCDSYIWTRVLLSPQVQSLDSTTTTFIVLEKTRSIQTQSCHI